jgi:hypothetical protein
MAAILLFIVGCATNRSRLVLDPVGPPPILPVDSKGSLVVFSAFDLSPHFDIGERSIYTDYEIFLENGNLLEKVHNDTGGLAGDGPIEVKLPSGTYHVLAEASGYGVLTVPVVIVDHRTTTVHLDGTPTPYRKEMILSNAVSLPNGKFVGWRANAEKISKP